MTDAIDPVRLLEYLQHLHQAVFRCTAYPSADASRSASLSTLQFRLEDCMPGTSHVELPSASTDILETLRHDPPQNTLDWKRTSTNPFAEDWEQILAWVQANPDRTSADIFRALQRRSPGRYRPAHLHTLQRGIRQIRRQLLAVGKQGEAIEMSTRDESPEHTVSRSCVGKLFSSRLMPWLRLAQKPGRSMLPFHQRNTPRAPSLPRLILRKDPLLVGASGM